MPMQQSTKLSVAIWNLAILCIMAAFYLSAAVQRYMYLSTEDDRHFLSTGL